MAGDPRPDFGCRNAQVSNGRASSQSLLGKAFDILGVFDQSRRSMTLSELARGSGLPKSTTHRLLGMLQDVGAVERVDDRYQVGLRMFSMGACTTGIEIRDTAMPLLQRIHRATGQTVNLALLRGHDTVHLAKLTSAATLTPALVGGTLPAHATAAGKALLAYTDSAIPPPEALVSRTPSTITHPKELASHLQRVRLLGYALDREESARGVSCVGVPVLVRNEAVAAISVSFPSGQGTGEQLVAPLHAASAAIGRALGARHALV